MNQIVHVCISIIQSIFRMSFKTIESINKLASMKSASLACALGCKCNSGCSNKIMLGSFKVNSDLLSPASEQISITGVLGLSQFQRLQYLHYFHWNQQQKSKRLRLVINFKLFTYSKYFPHLDT